MGSSWFGQGPRLHENQVQVQCGAAEVHYSSQDAGAFSFCGASFVLPMTKGKRIQGKRLEGRGAHRKWGIDRFPSRWDHRETARRVLLLRGTPESFQMEVRARRADRPGWRVARGEACMGNKGRKFEGLSFQGEGWVSGRGALCDASRSLRGSLAPLYQTLGGKGILDGRYRAAGEGFSPRELLSCDWSLQAKGELRSGIGFYCPLLEKKGEQFSFDIRIENPSWDWVRLYGIWDGLEFLFHPSGPTSSESPFKSAPAFGMETVYRSCNCMRAFPCSRFRSCAYLFSRNKGWSAVPIAGVAFLDLSFLREGGSSFSIDGPNQLG